MQESKVEDQLENEEPKYAEVEMDVYKADSVNAGSALLTAHNELRDFNSPQYFLIRSLIRDPQLTRLSQLYWALPMGYCLKTDERQALKKYIYTGRGELLESRAAISQAYFLHYYSRAKSFTTKVVWPIIVLSLLINDFASIISLPFSNFQTFFTQIFFGISFTPFAFSAFQSNDIFPAMLLYFIPALLGMVYGIINWPWSKNFDIDNIVAQLERPSRDFQGDTIYWLLPTQVYRRYLNHASSAILFNGNLHDTEREALLKMVIRITKKHRQIAQLQGLNALCAISDSKLEYVRQTAQQALLDASNVHSYNRFKIGDIPKILFANYLLWSSGVVPIKGILQVALQYIFFTPFFLIEQFCRFRIYAYLLSKIITTINFMNEKNSCDSDGGQYILNEPTDSYACSMCPNWPVYFEEMKSAQDCLDGLLHRPRNIHYINSLILDIIGKKSVIDTINLKEQYLAEWSQEEFSEFLDHFKKSIISLFRFDASAKASVNQTLNNSHSDILHNFLEKMPIHEVLLNNQMFTTQVQNKLFSAIASHKYLVKLSINNITLTDASVTTLANLINITPLAEINLANNQITDQGFYTIAQLISGKSISLFNIASNALTMLSTDSINQLISSNSIQRFDLSGNNFQGADFSPLNSTNATTYILNNCQMSNLEVQTITVAINRGIVSGLGLSDNTYIDDQGIISIIRASIGKPFFELTMAGAQVTGDGLRFLGDNLAALAIKYLDISNLQFSTVEFNIFVENIAGSKLESLVANENFLGENGLDGLTALFNKSNGSLKNLSIIDNNFHDSELAKFISSMTNSMLIGLKLGKNEFGSRAAKALKAVLPKSKLELIDLSDCQISAVEFHEFYEELAISNVKTVVMDHNQLDDLVNVEFIAQLIAPTPDTNLLLKANINLHDKIIIAAASPRGALSSLSLRDVNATSETMQAICRVMFRTNLKIKNLDISENPGIRYGSIDPETCLTRVPLSRSLLNPNPSYRENLHATSTSNYFQSSHLAIGLFIPVIGLVIIALLILRCYSNKTTKSTRNRDEISRPLSFGNGIFHKKMNGNSVEKDNMRNDEIVNISRESTLLITDIN